jgi:integrase
VLTEAELAKLLKACEGTTFEHRRDLAIVRLLIDCGARVSGIGQNGCHPAGKQGRLVNTDR